MTSESVNTLSEKMLCTAVKESPLLPAILNNALCICLAAAIISTHNKNENETLTFRHWIDAIKTKETVSIRDILFDIIYPYVSSDLRQETDVLVESRLEPELFTSMVIALFEVEPDKTLIQQLVDHIAEHYYPQVINEAISTPAPVNKLCISVVDPLKGSFYDGAAGLGSTCVAADNYSKMHNGYLKIYAQEKITILCAVSAIRAFVHNIQEYYVRNGDVLTHPRYVEGNHIKQFDYSIMFPPLGASWASIEDELKYSQYHGSYIYYVPKSNSEWLFIMHQIASIRDGSGRGIIAVSTGTLYNFTSRRIREEAIRKGYIDCIITLPSKTLYNTPTPLSLIVINKALQKKSAILMIQAEGLFSKSKSIRIVDQLNEQVIDRIVSIYKEKSFLPGVSREVSSEELLEGDCLLLPSCYMSLTEMQSEFGRINIDFKRANGWTKVGELGVIYRGLNISKSAIETTSGGYRVINYADVKNGELDITALKTYEFPDIKKPVKYMVQQGDVLVSCKGVVIKTCIVPCGSTDIYLTLNFIGIRLDKGKCHPRYLKYYLESPVGQAYLANRQVGTSIITLKNKDIEEIPIFLPPIKEQLRITSEYEESCRVLNENIARLQLCIRNEKWRLYSQMGLENVMSKIESEDVK